MTSTVSVAELTKHISEFSDMMTAGMKRSVRKHFKEYMLGIMIPPEFSRKSISSISSLVAEYDQSTINRALHGVDSNLLEQNYIRFLKTVIGSHGVMFIGDDTMLGHPRSKIMENVGWLFDHASGSNVLAHQSVTSVLYDIVTDTFYPFLTGLYIKKIQSGEELKQSLRSCRIYSVLQRTAST